MGKKSMTKSDFKIFSDEFQRLKTSSAADKEDQLNNLFDSMEQDLTYLGSSAIEDKLQDGVPEAIAPQV